MTHSHGYPLPTTGPLHALPNVRSVGGFLSEFKNRVIAGVVVVGFGTAIVVASWVSGLFGTTPQPTPLPTLARVSAAPGGVPAVSGSSANEAAAGDCSGPAKVIVDHFYPDAVQGGGATAPMFDTAGKRYCLTHLATYHWEGGKGAKDGGTFTLREAAGRILGGPWKATATPATGGVLANWEADVIPVLVISGSFTLDDSGGSTLSWSTASGGAGFVRVWGTEYSGP